MTSDALRQPSVLTFFRRHWRLIVVSVIGWSLLAAIPVTSAYLGTGSRGFAVWWAMFKKIGLYYYLWGLTAPALYRLSERLPYHGSGLLYSVPVHVAALLTLSFGFGFIVHAEAWYEWLFGARAIGYHSMSLFTYTLIVLCSLTVQFYRLSLLRQREASAAKIQAAQLDNQLNLARVDSLRMQMNPHFLFNALNSVAALVDSQRNDRAYEALEQLGSLLRQALALSTEKTINLGEEIDFCESYLAIEQLRFGDRLNVVWCIDAALRDLAVPAFILQPAVENAIKHAVSRSADSVTVTIAARMDGGELVLTVTDDGRAVGGPGDTLGVGLGNLRERLRLLYGPDARVESGPQSQGFRTQLRIPAAR